MEAFLGFLAGVFVNWYAIGILSVFGCAFSDSDHDIVATIIFAIIIIALINMFGIVVTPTLLVTYAVGYVMCGFIWSFWRYRRYLTAKIEKIKDRSSNLSEWDIKQLQPSEMVDKIVVWVIAWPFSFITNLFGDVIDTIRSLINTAFRRVYDWIYRLTVNDFVESLAQAKETDKG